jgi:hypothetical protein
VFADDIRWTCHGSLKYENLLIALLLWAMVGTPLSPGKVRGGLALEWLGYWIDYGRFRVGISESRTRWVLQWAREIADENLVLVRKVAQGLGRLCFASGVLSWIKPFLAPLFAWTSAAPQGATLPLPKMCRMVLLWVAEHLGAGHFLRDCSKPRKFIGERFRTDAKGEPDRVTIGGWESCSFDGDLKKCRWFYYVLTPERFPFLFVETKRGVQSSPTISSGEMLATMVAVHLFTPDSAKGSRSVCKFSAKTDNQGNSFISVKNLTTKWPLAAVWMQLSLHLSRKDLEMQLEWLPRDENQPADDITNGIFDRFDDSLRVTTTLDELLQDMDITVLLKLIGAWDELDSLIKKRKLDLSSMVAKAPPIKKRRKLKEKWGAS